MNPRANRGSGANFAKIRERWPFKAKKEMTVERINALLLKYGLTNKSSVGSRLHYYGNDGMMGETWILDGITPVHRGYVEAELRKVMAVNNTPTKTLPSSAKHRTLKASGAGRAGKL